MKAALKRIALMLLTSDPVYTMLRKYALQDDPITILCYHTLRPDNEPLDAWTTLGVNAFRDQITLLRKTYDIVSLDEALTLGSRGRPRAVLTFDDGERGLFDHLLPIVEEEDLPVTVYVATEQFVRDEPFWFDQVMNALQGAGEILIDLTDHGLNKWKVGPARGKTRWVQIGLVIEALKARPLADRDRLAAEVVAQAGPATDGFTPLHPMTLVQLKELAAHPLVAIGAHSHGHELLDQISIDAARISAARSRELLQDWTQQPVHHFAYPNGNYTPALMAMLKEEGFASATILEDRLMRTDAPALSLPRIGVGRYDSFARFKLRLIEI